MREAVNRKQLYQRLSACTLVYVFNRLVTVPSASSPPSAGYSVSLLTGDDVYLLGGAGADRSATVIETLGVNYLLPASLRFSPVAAAPARLQIENAGTGGGGSIGIYVVE